MKKFILEKWEALLHNMKYTDIVKTCIKIDNAKEVVNIFSSNFEKSKRYRNSGNTMPGWFNTYYIGPTSDEILKQMPTPVHAADYIAQQHDIDYQELGLNGIQGTLDTRSKSADRKLITRCTEVIEGYENGVTQYHGYTINAEAYQLAQCMRQYFIVEETLSELIEKAERQVRNIGE